MVCILLMVWLACTHVWSGQFLCYTLADSLLWSWHLCLDTGQFHKHAGRLSTMILTFLPWLWTVPETFNLCFTLADSVLWSWDPCLDNGQIQKHLICVFHFGRLSAIILTSLPWQWTLPETVTCVSDWETHPYDPDIPTFDNGKYFTKTIVNSWLGH